MYFRIVDIYVFVAVNYFFFILSYYKFIILNKYHKTCKDDFIVLKPLCIIIYVIIENEHTIKYNHDVQRVYF